MEKEYKVLMLCLPLSGHFNPFLCYAGELAKRKNVKVIMYANKEHQSAIEKTNIEYRNLEVENLSDRFEPVQLRKGTHVHKLIHFFMTTTAYMLPELVRCVIEEDIDLIVFDFMTVYAKWLLKYLDQKYQRGELKRPPPKSIMFAPSLLSQQGVYPNSFEEMFAPKPSFSINSMFNMLMAYCKLVLFCYKYDLPYVNPIDLIFNTKEDFNICCIVPEFQPRAHLFPSSIRFVGNCACEEVRKQSEFYEPLNSFLQPYPAVNPQPLVNLRVETNNNIAKKLVYVSLGTIVNKHTQTYLTILEAIKMINQSIKEQDSALLPEFLMSVGDISYSRMMAMVKNKELEVPDNVLILSRVPQLEVLKRASLFVTHSGQGSTSESIHYGVPMVCIPVMGDQPAVAYRVSDELGLGIRLDFDKLTAPDVQRAVESVLNDVSYLERVLLFSQISRKYNGTKLASQLTIEYLQQKATKC